MKWYFIIGGLAGGGAEKAILNMCHYLNKIQFPYQVVVLDDSITSAYDLSGIQVVSLRIPTFFKKHFLLKTIYCSFKVRKIISGDTHIEKKIFSHLIFANTVCKLARIKNYFVIHSNTSTEFFVDKNIFLRYFLKWLFRNQDIITVSKGVEEDIKNNITKEYNSIQKIFNPLDIAEIRLKGKEPNKIILSRKYIVGVGSLAVVKRFDILIKAFKLSELYKEYDLYIVGQGALKESLESYIESLELTNSVKLIGFSSNPYSIIKNSEMLVVSSEREGMGMVLVETLILGKKVVSTDCFSGPREILREKFKDYLAEVNNPNDLAEKMKKAVTSYPPIEESDIEDFKVETIFKQYMKL
ncbi:MAG: glycosyltransferase [Chitinophagaceae bacterium]|nr:glycosyltransferase [Chitinophagaceae bacterium]